MIDVEFRSVKSFSCSVCWWTHNGSVSFIILYCLYKFYKIFSFVNFLALLVHARKIGVVFSLVKSAVVMAVCMLCCYCRVCVSRTNFMIVWRNIYNGSVIVNHPRWLITIRVNIFTLLLYLNMVETFVRRNVFAIKNICNFIPIKLLPCYQITNS